MTMKDLIISHAPRESMAARLAELAVRPATPCYYFGCIGRSGHFLWSAATGGVAAHASRDIEREICAVFGALDGTLCWNWRAGFYSCERDETEGRALLTHRTGWTAIAFWDRSVDRRGACNSVFLAPGTLTFNQIARLARHRFPQVWQRFGFPVVEVDATGREVAR